MTGGVDQCVRRLDVLMDETLTVGLAQCRRQTHGDAQAAGQIERMSLVPPDDTNQGYTARILKNEDCSPLMTGQRERLGAPRGIECARERPFVFEQLEAVRRRLVSGDRQDR